MVATHFFNITTATTTTINGTPLTRSVKMLQLHEGKKCDSNNTKEIDKLCASEEIHFPKKNKLAWYP